jgi:hypothetical protein
VGYFLKALYHPSTSGSCHLHFHLKPQALNIYKNLVKVPLRFRGYLRRLGESPRKISFPFSLPGEGEQEYPSKKWRALITGGPDERDLMKEIGVYKPIQCQRARLFA